MKHIYLKNRIFQAGIVVILMILCLEYVKSQSYKTLPGVSCLITDECDSYEIIFKDCYDTISVSVLSENLCNKGKRELGIKRMTEWFPVDEQQKTLSMYGGFNYARWEFADIDGNITRIDHDDAIYNDVYDTTLANNSIDSVNIPKKSTMGRVTYFKDQSMFLYYLKCIVKGILQGDFKEGMEQCAKIRTAYDNLKNQEVYINYGLMPSTASLFYENTFSVNSIENGDILQYTQEKGWILLKKNGEEMMISCEVELHEGNSICIYAGNEAVAYQVAFDGQSNYEDKGVYGIRWKIDSTDIVCERVADSIYFHTNYLINDTWAVPYLNDFDNVYPWAEIRECYMDDSGKVYYYLSDEMEQSELNHMVEIPKFYVKREQSEGYEYIYISKYPKDGFDIDPAFRTENGSIADYVYVGKYLSSISDGKIGCYDDTVPLIDLSLNDINNYVDEKGQNWEELDLVTLNMLQRLWLVETGVKNSQSIFKGYTEATFIWSSNKDPKYAVKSEENTNRIYIKKTDYTSKLRVGDNVIVITYLYEDCYSAYLYFTDNYKNDNKIWQRCIVDIQEKNSMYEISFSGEAMNIIQDQSIIANLPVNNGTTDDILYHSGTSNEIAGKDTFKYRNMENMWGVICTILDNAYIKDETFVIQYPSGETAVMECNLPKQSKGGSVAKSFECGVKSFSYDADNSLIMFPETISEGATLTNSFGDWYARPLNDFYMDSEKDSIQYITYGMTWDLANYAGLFAYRIQPTETMRRVENGSRLIWRD